MGTERNLNRSSLAPTSQLVVTVGRTPKNIKRIRESDKDQATGNEQAREIPIVLFTKLDATYKTSDH
jgi:predicted transcriptional regulator